MMLSKSMDPKRQQKWKLKFVLTDVTDLGLQQEESLGSVLSHLVN